MDLWFTLNYFLIIINLKHWGRHPFPFRLVIPLQSRIFAGLGEAIIAFIEAIIGLRGSIIGFITSIIGFRPSLHAILPDIIGFIPPIISFSPALGQFITALCPLIMDLDAFSGGAAAFNVSRRSAEPQRKAGLL